METMTQVAGPIQTRDLSLHQSGRLLTIEPKSDVPEVLNTLKNWTGNPDIRKTV